ncbi:MAG: aldehyde ferredoxin oxidoreductase C-terminal domain-containing protein [Thermodesulfobacteriota bacterium]|nr:aldehyde ferredoxin oxidoreductase C-terminal domain-containing protein [Thermodesulfobacteriota bacterium]
MEEGQEWSDEELVDTVIYHQTLRPLFDMLGVCRLPWIELGLNEKRYENFYRYVTGKSVTLEELLMRSNDIYDHFLRFYMKIAPSSQRSAFSLKRKMR